MITSKKQLRRSKQGKGQDELKKRSRRLSKQRHGSDDLNIETVKMI